jgi:hypothetical protein
MTDGDFTADARTFPAGRGDTPPGARRVRGGRGSRFKLSGAAYDGAQRTDPGRCWAWGAAAPGLRLRRRHRLFKFISSAREPDDVRRDYARGHRSVAVFYK